MNTNKPIVINFFGGPGSGKSTTALEIAAYLKRLHLVTEYTHEEAKDHTYSKNSIALSDQLYLLANQHHKLWRLAKNDIKYIVNDSPIILGLTYFNDNSKYNFETFQNMTMDCWSQYHNINIFINRQDSLYQEYGRSQNITEAKKIDEDIKNMLNYHGIKYYKIQQNQFAFEQTCNILRKEFNIE
jgi:RecA/RadA recombinase